MLCICKNGALYFYDCNEIVFLRKRPNGMERLSHSMLVFIMDIYSEAEQSNLTDNMKSGSTAYSEQRSKKGLETRFEHWKTIHHSNTKAQEDLVKQRTPQKYPGRSGLWFGVYSGLETLTNLMTPLEKKWLQAYFVDRFYCPNVSFLWSHLQPYTKNLTLLLY